MSGRWVTQCPGCGRAVPIGDGRQGRFIEHPVNYAPWTGATGKPCPASGLTWSEALEEAPPVTDLVATGEEGVVSEPIEVHTHQEGAWWVIDIPGFGVTQARYLDDVPRMTKDCIACLGGPTDVDILVTVTPSPTIAP